LNGIGIPLHHSQISPYGVEMYAMNVSITIRILSSGVDAFLRFVAKEFNEAHINFTLTEDKIVCKDPTICGNVCSS
jgi:hypothetical protein